MLESINRIRSTALVFGTICLLASVAGAIFSGGERFYRSYLFAWLFWLQLGIGSTGLLMISFLTGGEWAARVRRILEAGNRTTLCLAILFIPILVGMRQIYPWTGEPQRHNALYLNVPFFFERAILYLLSWIIFARVLDRTSQRNALARLRTLSAGGLVYYSFSASFASVDWQMSLEPDWFSTIYGMIFGVSQCLVAFAFTLVIFAWIATATGEAGALSKKILRDLGNILFMFIIVWTYLSFMQYLIIWSGNLPEEVNWVARRTHNGWQWPGLLIVLFQFAVPFLLLLFRPVKTHPKMLAAVAFSHRRERRRSLLAGAALALRSFSARLGGRDQSPRHRRPLDHGLSRSARAAPHHDRSGGGPCLMMVTRQET